MDPRELKSALKNARESIKNKEFKEALRYCKVRKFDKLFKTQQNYFNMQDNEVGNLACKIIMSTCNIILLHVILIMLHVDINKLHGDIDKLHVDIIYLSCRG